MANIELPGGMAIYTVTLPAAGSPATLRSLIVALSTPAGAVPSGFIMGGWITPAADSPGALVSYSEPGAAVPAPHSGGGTDAVAASQDYDFLVSSPLDRVWLQSATADAAKTAKIHLVLQQTPNSA